MLMFYCSPEYREGMQVHVRIGLLPRGLQWRVRLALVRGHGKKLSVVYEWESSHFIPGYLIWALFSVGVAA